jgi:hypothetical protein
MQARTKSRVAGKSPFFHAGRLLVSRSLLRLAAPVYLVLMALVWLMLLWLWLGGSGGRDRSGVVLGPDFPAFYTGGWLVGHGEYTKLYDLQRQAQIQSVVLPGFEGVSAYLNPPHYALLMTPLSFLPYSAAFAVWTLLMASAFAGSVLLLRLLLPALHERQGRLLGLLAFFSAPVYYALSAGQNTGLSLLLHTAILLALVRKHDIFVGVLIAAGMLKPQLFVGLLPLLLIDRRWRSLLSFAAVSAVIGGVTLGLGGLAIIEQWVSLLRSDVYHDEIARQAAKMYSWQSVWSVLFGPGTITSVLGTLSALLVFGALCYLWWRRIGDLPLRYAVTLCGLMMMGPHLFVYDLGLLVLPGLIFADRLLREPSHRWLQLRIALLALYVLVLFAGQQELQANLIIVPLITLLAVGMSQVRTEN